MDQFIFTDDEMERMFESCADEERLEQDVAFLQDLSDALDDLVWE